MKAFAELYGRLDRTNSTLEKTAALRDYFSGAAAADAAWAVYFLSGNRPRQAISAPKLRALAADAAGIPMWLFEESYDAVGDLAETIAHLLPPPSQVSDAPLHRWIEERLLPLPGLPEDERLVRLRAAWDELDWTGRLVWNKLTTGSFRVGVSAQLVMRALAQVSGVDADVVAHRLAGEWAPSAVVLRSARLARYGCRRSEPPLSVLSVAPPGGESAFPRRGGRLAGRVEMGRHPLPSRAARRTGLSLVARRRAG